MKYKTKRNKFERDVDKKILFLNADYVADVLVKIVKSGDDIVIGEPVVELAPGNDMESVKVIVHWNTAEFSRFSKIKSKILGKDLRGYVRT